MKTIAVSLACVLLLVALPARADIEYPLQVDPSGRLLVDQSDRPVFFNAETPWHILTRLNQVQTVQYLDIRAADGFNALLISILVDDEFNSGSSDNIFGEAPFTTAGDFSTPNEAYFAHLDWFLDQCHQRGMVVFLCPAYIGWGCTIEGFCQEMMANGTAVMRDYGRYLGNRYQNQPNIVWVNGGDADAGAHGAMDVVDALAEGIREVDPDHLHTGHCNRLNSGIDCYDRPWLDINNTYADCDRTSLETKRDYEVSPELPFFYIEGRYEFESDWNDRCLRTQAYASLLGGAMGHFFGSGRIWDFPGNWQTGMDTQGIRSMEHFGKLLRSRRWDRLVPDYGNTSLTAGFGNLNNDSYAAAARTVDGSTLLIYTPSQRTLTVAMNRIAGENAMAWWFNPADGSNTFIGTFPTTGSRDFNPPTASDWVLVVDSGDANLDPPGQTDIYVPTWKQSFGSFKQTFGR